MHLKNKSGFHELPLLIVIIVFLGVGGYYFYNNYYLTPERIYSQMTQKMQSLQKGHVEIDTSINLGGGKSLVDLFVKAINPEVSGFKLSGDFDVSNAENPKYKLSTQMSKYSKDAFDIDVLAVDGMNYQHIEYTGEDKDNNNLLYYPDGWFVQKEDPELKPASLSKFKDISSFSDSVVKITKLPESNIGQTKTYHYSLDIDQTVFQRNFENLMNELDFQFENREVQNLIDELKVTKAEVWIGKSDHYLHRAYFEFETDLKSTTARISTTIDFSEFGNIEEMMAPEEFMEIDFNPKEVVNERMTPADQARMIRINFIANAVREFYKNNGVLPDTDGNPNSFSYPASPTCISPYATNCFRLADAGYESSEDFISPKYMRYSPYEIYEEFGHEHFLTYHRNGKIYVSAVGDITKDLKTERVLSQ